MEFNIELVPDDDDLACSGDSLSANMSPRMMSDPAAIFVGFDNPPSILDREVFSSYISGNIITVQPAKRYFDSEPACLLILCFVFHPAIGRRFSQAEISCSFETTDDSDPLTIVEHAPRLSFGGFSQADGRWTFGLTMPFKATTPMGGEAGVEPSVSNTTSKTMDHYMVIRGSARGPQRRQCVWILEENRSRRGGMPFEFHSAIILRSKAELELKVVVKAELSGGWLSRKIKSKNATACKVSPTKLFGRQLHVKESLDEIHLRSWFSGAMEDTTVALTSVIPQP